MHMDFEHQEELAPCMEAKQKWKLVSDFICNNDRYKLREMLKKINTKLYSDPSLISKLVFRNKKNTNKGIGKLKNYVSNIVDLQKDDPKISNKKLSLLKRGSQLEEIIPFISLTQSQGQENENSKQILCGSQLKRSNTKPKNKRIMKGKTLETNSKGQLK